MTRTQKTGTVPLYRVENPTHPSPRKPDGFVSHEDIVGQWFSPNLDTALRYLPKSTQTFDANSGPVYGTQLVVAQVPSALLDSLHVSAHPIAAGMDVEEDNYIVPRDGSFETEIIPLDETLGELRGHLQNFYKLQEAKQRVYALLGSVAVQE